MRLVTSCDSCEKASLNPKPLRRPDAPNPETLESGCIFELRDVLSVMSQWCSMF